MKTRYFILLFIFSSILSGGQTFQGASSKTIGNMAIINATPCLNEGFELTTQGTYTGAVNYTAVAGWTISSQSSSLGLSCASSSIWANGSPEFSVQATPVFAPFIGTLPTSPFGGSKIAVINNSTSGGISTKLSQTFPVTGNNNIFNYAWAGIIQGDLHNCCDGSQFRIHIKNSNGQILPCFSRTISTPSCSSSLTNFTLLATVSENYYYSNWQISLFDFSAYIGSNLTIEVIASDCVYGGHYANMYFDSNCTSAPLPACNCFAPDNLSHINYCAGTTQAIITASPGMQSYSWTAPPTYTLSAASATLAAITITNAAPLQVFTVSMITPNGCVAQQAYTIVPTTVGAGTYAVTGACNNLATGAATIYPTGSGTGYNYTWYNSTGSIVSTASVLNNAPSGLYTVTFSAAPGCGTASAAINIPANNLDFSLTPASAFSLCTGSSATVGISFLTPTTGINYSINWSPPTFLLFLNSLTAMISPSAPTSSISSTIYTVQISAPNLNCFPSKTLSIVAGSNVPPTLSPVPPLCSNSGNTFQVQALPPGGVFSSQNTTAINPSGVISASLAPLGTNAIIYSINLAGCITTASRIYTVWPPPPVSIAGNSLICDGQSMVLTASGANTYSWSNIGAGAQVTVTPGASTTFSVTGTNTLTGCSNKTSLMVNVVANPTVTITGQNTICAGQSTSLSASGANTYTWSDGTSGPSIILSPTVNPATFTVTGASTLANCTSQNSITVFSVPYPTLTVVGNKLICEGDMIVLTAGGADSYTWNNNMVGPTYTAIPSTTTILILKGQNQALCETSQSITVNTDQCLSIQNVQKKLLPQPQPNPFSGIIKIELPQSGWVIITDMLGKKIVDAFFNAGETIFDLGFAADGVYTFSFVSESNHSVKKIIKARSQ